MKGTVTETFSHLLVKAICRTLRVSDQKLVHDVVHHFLAAVFVASAVHLLHGLWIPAELAVRATITAVTPYLNRQGAGHKKIAVIKIDKMHYRSVDGYQGRSPLDRCRLTSDAELIKDSFPNLKNLILDLDLSPNSNKRDEECREGLMRFLVGWKKEREKNNKVFNVITILPVDEDDRKESRDWLAEMKGMGVSVANPDIIIRFGLAYAIPISSNCPSLGRALYELELNPERQAIVCDSNVGDPYDCTDRSSCSLLSFQSLKNAVNIDRLYDKAELMPLKEQILAVKSELIETLMLGSAYSTKEDVFETSVGPLGGVDIHYAELLRNGSIEKEHDGLAFLFDVVIGFFFGFLVHKNWSNYFYARLSIAKLSKGLAWLLLLRMVLVMMASWLVLICASTLLLGYFDTWVNVSAMLIGMLLDAFVFGSVSSAETVLRRIHCDKERLNPIRSAGENAGGVLSSMLVQVPSLCWFVVVVWAFVILLGH